MQLIWVDWLIIVLLFISTLISVVRGFVQEGLSLLSWVAALFCALHFTRLLSHLLSTHITNSIVRDIISFSVILIFVVIIGSLINRLFTSFMRKIGLGGLDHILGIIFGFARGVLIISVILFLAQMTTFSKMDWWQHSKLIPPFHFLVHQLQHFLSHDRMMRIKRLSNWHVL